MRAKAGRTDPAGCVEVAATDPLYILYTSGTTGKPKGIVRDNGGHAVALAWSLPNDLRHRAAGDVWWAASDVGWVVGHSYIVYAPLIDGATTVLYEGQAGRHSGRRAPSGGSSRSTASRRSSPPRPRIRAIKQGGPGGSPTGRLRHLLAAHSLPGGGAAGSRTPSTGPVAKLGVPVVDNWWQTETGWPIAANLRGLDDAADQAGLAHRCPCPATTCRCSTSAANPCPPATEGAICIKLPLPPGTLPTLWGDDERYRRVLPLRVRRLLPLR
ncbi:MAG: AMP-binding protein [Nocardioides sp.]